MRINQSLERASGNGGFDRSIDNEWRLISKSTIVKEASSVESSKVNEGRAIFVLFSESQEATTISSGSKFTIWILYWWSNRLSLVWIDAVLVWSGEQTAVSNGVDTSWEAIISSDSVEVSANSSGGVTERRWDLNRNREVSSVFNKDSVGEGNGYSPSIAGNARRTNCNSSRGNRSQNQINVDLWIVLSVEVSSVIINFNDVSVRGSNSDTFSTGDPASGSLVWPAFRLSDYNG